jgi:hypothetical protein
MKNTSVWKSASAAAAIRAAAALLAVFITVTACSEKKGSWDENPQSFFKPTKSDIVDDADTGLQIVKDVISVTFDPRTDEDTVKKIISTVNGEIVGYDKSVNLYQVRFKGKSLPAIDDIRKKLLSGHKQVEAATRMSVSVHKDPYYVK